MHEWQPSRAILGQREGGIGERRFQLLAVQGQEGVWEGQQRLPPNSTSQASETYMGVFGSVLAK